MRSWTKRLYLSLNSSPCLHLVVRWSCMQSYGGQGIFASRVKNRGFCSENPASVHLKTVASIQNRIRSLLQAVRDAQNDQSCMIRLERFNENVLQYIHSGRNEAIRHGAIETIIDLSKSSNAEIRREAGKGLVLLGNVQPVNGWGIRVLTIDGGGSRGIAPIEILKRIEDNCNKEIYELFDLICGVSTGAILAVLIGIKKMPLEECEYVYKNLSMDIFERNTLIGTGKLFWTHAFYDTIKLEDILKDHGGKMRLIDSAFDLSTPKIAIVSTVVNQPVLKPYVFSNYTHPFNSLPRFPGSCQYRIWEALKASCAAPGFFEECRLDNDVHQVQATFIGAEGNGNWECTDSYSGFRIAAIKEEDEDGAETVNSEKTTGDKCEKDSGFGRTDESTKNDESSEHDTLEKLKRSKDKSSRKGGLDSPGETPPHTPKKESKSSRTRNLDSVSSSKESSSRNVDKESSKRSPERSDKERNKHSPDRTEKKRSNGSPTHKDKQRSERKRKDESLKDRTDRDREKDRDRDKVRDRDRDKGKHSDHRRSRRLGCVDRSIRASYMRACNSSMQQIDLFGIDDPVNSRSDQRRRKYSKEDSSNEAGAQQNEWRVRMTKDGKHIFVRKQTSTTARQTRNKLLRDRAQKITEERRGLTTEDETQSVYQGRYCPRDMRRRQLEKVRQARTQRHLKQRGSDSPHTGSGSESGAGRRDLIVELSKRKMLKNTDRSFDDFVTVQELLVQRNLGGCQSGPIHVTTV